MRPAAVAAPAWPLTLRLSYCQVLKSDLRPPAPPLRQVLTSFNAQVPPQGQAEPECLWSQPMHLLDLNAPLRVERFVEEFTLAADQPDVPLVLPALPRNGIGFMDFADNAPGLLSARAELRDATGRLLARRLLVELYSSEGRDYTGQAAWVTEDVEADRVLRERYGISNVQTVPQLPPLFQPYGEVAAVWLSAPDWQRQPLDPALLRRLLLSGRWIYARPETAAAIAARAELAAPQRVLLGGLCAVSKPADGAVSVAGPHGGSRQLSLASAPWNPAGPAAATLENNQPVFRARGAFLGWTFLMLGLFGLLVAVGLPLAFYRLKGPRRLLLWWLAPGMAAAVGLIGWLGGRLLLPRAVQTDVTEYRLAYAPWPEVCCQSVAQALQFEEPQLTWRLPAGSWELATGYQPNNLDRRTIAHQPAADRFGFRGLRRGDISRHEFLCFRKLALPVELARQGDKPCLKVLQPLRNLHVLERGRWRVVGAAAAGQLVDIGACVTTNQLAGLPDPLRELFEACAPIAPCTCSRHAGAAPEPNPARAVLGNDWVVLAVADEEPAAQVDRPGVQRSGRVAWIIQLPLETPRPPEDRPHG